MLHRHAVRPESDQARSSPVATAAAATSVASSNRAGRASCSEVARLAAGALEAPEGTIHGMRASQSLELPGLQAEGTQIS